MSENKFNVDIELFFRKLKDCHFFLIGDKIKARQGKFENLRTSLRQARIPMSYEIYISNAMFYSLIAGIVGALIGLMFAYIVISVVGLPARLTHLTFSESTAWLLGFQEYSHLIFYYGLSDCFVRGHNVWFIPSLSCFFRQGKKTIHRQEPRLRSNFYVCTEPGGMNIIDILRSLSKSESTYGEVPGK